MPPVGSVWNVEWLNANSQRRYPLFEEATGKDTSDSFEIPNDFIVDFIWPVQSDPTIDTTKFHVASVSAFGTGVALSIGYDGTVIGSVAIDASAFTRGKQYLIQGLGDFEDTEGKIVIWSLDKVLDSAGVFSFDVAGARLEPTTIRPTLRGVSAVYIKNGDDISDPITGDVILEAGSNMLLQFVSAPAGESDRIQLNAIEGEGLNETCDCAEATDLPCLKTINGIGPDDAGDFALVGDDCLELNAIANGIQIEEKCAKPCCGCDELEIVKQKCVIDMTDQIYALERLASQLEGAIQQISINLLASRTGIQQ
jgi:hypothetical protein